MTASIHLPHSAILLSLMVFALNNRGEHHHDTGGLFDMHFRLIVGPHTRFREKLRTGRQSRTTIERIPRGLTINPFGLYVKIIERIKR
jgi:hypothetical protein